MSWTSHQMLEKGKIPIEDTTTGYTAAVHSYQNQDHTPSDARFGRLNGWCCGDAPAALRVQHTLQQPKPAIVQSARAAETCSSCGFEKIAIRWTVLYVLLRFFSSISVSCDGCCRCAFPRPNQAKAKPCRRSTMGKGSSAASSRAKSTVAKRKFLSFGYNYKRKL